MPVQPSLMTVQHNIEPCGVDMQCNAVLRCAVPEALEAEITAVRKAGNCRLSKAKGRCAEMLCVRETRRLPVALKMQCHTGVCAYVMLVLLFGSKTKAFTRSRPTGCKLCTQVGSAGFWCRPRSTMIGTAKHICGPSVALSALLLTSAPTGCGG